MIALDDVRRFALGRPGTSEDFPFDESTLVIRVAGKMFVLLSTDAFPLRINLKCDPEEAVDLRERYEAIVPAYHQNKRHWNTVILDGSVPLDVVKRLIVNSYELVRNGLPKRLRLELGL